MSGIIFEQQKKQPRQNTEKTKRKGSELAIVNRLPVCSASYPSNQLTTNDLSYEIIIICLLQNITSPFKTHNQTTKQIQTPTGTNHDTKQTRPHNQEWKREICTVISDFDGNVDGYDNTLYLWVDEDGYMIYDE